MDSPVEAYLTRIRRSCMTENRGVVADYIPELAGVDPDLCALSMVVHDGHLYSVGDRAAEFTIQSISKALTYAYILQQWGREAVDSYIGVEPSGEPFNVISVDDDSRRPKNPMINVGAVTAAAVVLGLRAEAGAGARTDVDGGFSELMEFYSGCAGRSLTMDHQVYVSEWTSTSRNRAIAYMLDSYGVLPTPPEAAVDLYVRQCSVRVTADDLACIGATLANGGVNPKTGRTMMDRVVVRRLLSVMTTCGMYDAAGDWVTSVGLPAKSGVGGGILAVMPGQLGIGVYSPRLDAHGNSVRGVAACRRLSDDLGLHMFNVARESRVTIRAAYDGAELDPAAVERPRAAACLRAHNRLVRVFELQGDLTFSGAEALVRRVQLVPDDTTVVVVDLKRVGTVDGVARHLLHGLGHLMAHRDLTWVMVDPDRVLAAEGGAGADVDRSTLWVTASVAEATNRVAEILAERIVRE